MPTIQPRSLLGQLYQFNRLLDAEGRPLGEGRIPESLRGETPFRFEKCPYSGARQGRPMNVSALGQMRRHWEEIRRLLAWASGAQTETNTWVRGHCASITVAALVPWWTSRRVEPLPPQIAGAYKVVMGGLPLLAELAWGHYQATAPKADQAAADFMALAENRGRFVADGEACAAPDHMLREALGDLFSERPAPPPNLPVEWADVMKLGALGSEEALRTKLMTAVDRAAEGRFAQRLGPTPSPTWTSPETRGWIGAELDRLRTTAPPSWPRLPSEAAPALTAEDAARLTDFRHALDGMPKSGDAGRTVLQTYGRLRLRHHLSCTKVEDEVATLLGQKPEGNPASDPALLPDARFQLWLELSHNGHFQISNAGAFFKRGQAENELLCSPPN